jgi:nucleoside phosphorylase
MSLSSFEAFSERGSQVGGEAATQAIHDYLLLKNAGARFVPRRIASTLGLGEEEVEELLEIAADAEVGLIEDASQIRCPFCDSRVDLALLRQREAEEGDVTCLDCEHELDDLDRLKPELRYRLTEMAATEAAAWQAERAARPKLRAVILTALPEELGAVREQMAACGATPARRKTNGGLYYEATIDGLHIDWTVYASFTQATTGEAAAGAVDAILSFEPKIALYVGIAGGIAEKGVKLGDVIAATEVFDYDGGKEDADGFRPRTRQLHSSFALTQLAGFTMVEENWRKRITNMVGGLDLGEPIAHSEPIAAGSKVVASTKSETFKLVRATADRAVAVEMEGSGFLGAIHRYDGVDGIIVRGASDLIDGKSASDEKGIRKQAAANAAAFGIEMLYEFQLEQQADNA